MPHTDEHGRAAALLVDRVGGLVYSRSITWVEHGYRFVGAALAALASLARWRKRHS